MLLASVSPSHAQPRVVGLTQEYSGTLCRDPLSARQLGQAWYEEGVAGYEQQKTLLILDGRCIFVPYLYRQTAATVEFIETWWNHERGQALILVRARIINVRGEVIDFYSLWVSDTS